MVNQAKKYLVTGGSGFLGSALVRALVKAGHQVRVLDNNSRGACRKIADLINNLEFIEADIRDKDRVLSASCGVDSIIHLAYINGTEFFYTKPDLVLDVGVRGMLNVLDACSTHNIKELILASSSEVYQTPPYVPTDEKVPLSVPDVLNPRYSYGGGKIISELLSINYARKNLERMIIFRPHNIYGADMGWEHVLPQFILRALDLIKAQPEGVIDFPIQGDGSQTRAFCHIDDFTRGLMLLLEKGEHLNIYHIGSPQEITMKEAAETVIRYFGREANVVQAQDLPAGGTPRRCPDIKKLNQLGFVPQISLAQGVVSMAQWYAQNYHLRPNSQ
ncbi:MAG: NAD(P)-dependent oxidoreductase [Candidatus Pacebacteria bacterium]|nr:NAD(P)-dependent oxidoreductase [Candidatus Paceibacterota bacterium]